VSKYRHQGEYGSISVCETVPTASLRQRFRPWAYRTLQGQLLGLQNTPSQLAPEHNIDACLTTEWKLFRHYNRPGAWLHHHHQRTRHQKSEHNTANKNNSNETKYKNTIRNTLPRAWCCVVKEGGLGKALRGCEGRGPSESFAG
jgi:hypothetical protein